MSRKLHAGDLVEVRSKEEILATLDRMGQMDGLPFMPEMLRYCGKRFRVLKRAHKTCDTVNGTGGRWVGNAVYLENLRCDGEAHGRCQAECLIFWWEAWLKRVPRAEAGGPIPSGAAASEGGKDAAGNPTACTEEDIVSGSQVPGPEGQGDVRYVCQATQLPHITRLLKWWDIRQYAEDLLSGNVGVWEMLRVFLFCLLTRIGQSWIGYKLRLLVIYDWIQARRRGIPFPRKQGVIPRGKPTPLKTLDLKPGELVRVKSQEEILQTIDQDNKNHGLTFDYEMVPYCGGTYRVQKRVTQIIHEKTGKMLTMKSDCIMLENVCCRAWYSDRRLFCPRTIPPYWREIWLDRVADPTSPIPQGAEAPRR